MLRLALVVVSLLVASSVSAQTQYIVFDLSTLGWGAVHAEPVNTDGDTETSEWAVLGVDFNINYGLRRVVAIHQDRWCVGPWFDPRPDKWASSKVIHTANGHDYLLVSPGFYPTAKQIVAIVSLDTPTCSR